jgi:hypothetical protein
MFGSTGLETGLDGEMLMPFPITTPQHAKDAAEVLGDTLMSATRFDAGMNLWIDVQLPHIPEFVSTAIEGCRAFGMRLVLTRPCATGCRFAPRSAKH